MSERKHIRQNGNVPEDKLMAYLEGRLSPDEQREIEAMLGEDGMESDALEGLHEISAQDARAAAGRINYKLQHELKAKKYRNKRQFADNKWAWMAVIIILLLCVMGYWVIKMQGN